MAGRKPKPEHRKLSERIPFVCTESQRRAYDMVSEACNMDRSEWIRSLLDAEVDRFMVWLKEQQTPEELAAVNPPADPAAVKPNAP